MRSSAGNAAFLVEPLSGVQGALRGGVIPSTKPGIVMLTLGREREEDCHARASFGYGTHSRPAWATQKYVFQNKRKKEKEKKRLKILSSSI